MSHLWKSLMNRELWKREKYWAPSSQRARSGVRGCNFHKNRGFPSSSEPWKIRNTYRGLEQKMGLSCLHIKQRSLHPLRFPYKVFFHPFFLLYILRNAYFKLQWQEIQPFLFPYFLAPCHMMEFLPFFWQASWLISKEEACQVANVT